MGGFPEVKDTRILRYFDTRLACRASIATGAEKERQDEARAYYADLRASGKAPVDEKAPAKK